MDFWRFTVFAAALAASGVFGRRDNALMDWLIVQLGLDRAHALVSAYRSVPNQAQACYLFIEFEQFGLPKMAGKLYLPERSMPLAVSSVRPASDDLASNALYRLLKCALNKCKANGIDEPHLVVENWPRS